MYQRHVVARATAALLMIVGSASASSGHDTPNKAGEPKVSVFVTGKIREGYLNVDKGVESSVKDINSELRKSKVFKLVSTDDEAQVVITVIARRTPGNSRRAPFPVGPGVSMMLPVRRRAIDILVKVGDAIDKEMTSEPQGDDRWSAAAKEVVKDVTAWVIANRSALVSPEKP